MRGGPCKPQNHTMPETPLAPPVSRLRRLRVDLGTIITVGVLGQAALLIGLGYWGAQRIVGTLAASVQARRRWVLSSACIQWCALCCSNSMVQRPLQGRPSASMGVTVMR